MAPPRPPFTAPSHVGPGMMFLVVPMVIQAAAAATAAPTTTTTTFVLTRASPRPECAASELAVFWPRLVVTRGGAASDGGAGSKGSSPSYSIAGLAPSSNAGMQGFFRFATATAPLPYGGGRTWTSSAFTPPPPEMSSKYTTYDTAGSHDHYSGDDFAGFAATLKRGLPPVNAGPFGPSTWSPDNYTFQAIPGGLRVTSPALGCSFDYALTAGAPFGGVSPAAAATAGARPCAPGAHPVQIEGTGAAVCALCPAGTFSADGRACAPCGANTAAAAAGSARCAACPAPLKPGAGAYSCVPCSAFGDNYTFTGAITNPGWIGNKAYASAPSCAATACANGTIATADGTACLAPALDVNGAAMLTPVPAGKKAPANAPPVGGAVLELVSADVGAKGCARGAAALAAALRGRRVWLGHSTVGFPYAPAYSAAPSLMYGINMQLLGAGGPSAPAPLPAALSSRGWCGNAHGGPGPQPSLTQGGAPLTPSVWAFGSVLKGDAGKSFDPVGWGMLLTKGSSGSDDTIVARMFQDTGVNSCGLTSLSPLPSPDVCTLTFKVIAGSSALGARAPPGARCPEGTFAVGNGGGCVACGPGTRAEGGRCAPCVGGDYMDAWGATQCKACPGGAKSVYPGKMTYENAPPEANTFCFTASGASGRR